MGLGPSIKMTTLHHYNCPVVKELSKHDDIDFSAIIVGGISENYDAKVFTAKRIGDMAKILGATGAIVAIDAWGNHHIDFVTAIEELGKNDILSVGLSFIGQQGRLVCINSYVETIVDFNKGSSGYESCVVGGNNLTEYDAVKAVALLKNKLKKKGLLETNSIDKGEVKGKLTKKIFHIDKVIFGEKTFFNNDTLIISKDIVKKYETILKRIKKINLTIVKPGEYNFFVNSNLDYQPIACKKQGELGSGITYELSGVKVMLTGVEDISQYQPANIGSSEGILKDQVKLNQAGTPSTDDYIIHIDFLFENGEGRTSEGIIEAHVLTDKIINEIRRELEKIENRPYKKEEYYDVIRKNKSKIILIKLVSGLGNMYDTMMFPYQPGGIIGAYNLRECNNLPTLITPNQCRDGIIHSLL
ncbi:glycine/sarcosine/betaine reductase component B subunit [Gemella morbillorum]